MNKVLICDLDDTLLLSRRIQGRQCKIMRKEDEAAIHRWTSLGNSFVIGTARHFSFLSNVTKKETFHFDTIGWNGAQIIIHGKSIVEHPLQVDDVQHLMNYFPEYQDHIRAANMENDYIFQRHDNDMYQFYQQHQNDGGYRSILHTSLSTYLKQPELPKLMHVSYCFEKEEDVVRYFTKLKKLDKQVFSMFSFKQTSSHSIDVTDVLATKEKGIQSYAKLLNIPLHDIAVAGDSKNDIGMFDLIRESYCMEAGNLEAKQHATYIVPFVEDVIEDLLRKEGG